MPEDSFLPGMPQHAHSTTPTKIYHSKSAPTTPPPPALEKDEKTKRWMPSPLPVEKLGQGGESLATRVQKLREQIFVRPMAVSQENTTAVAKIASCFGEQLVLPMALAIIALRYRKQDDPEILKLARKLAGIMGLHPRKHGSTS